MTTVAELTIAEELKPLRELAVWLGWMLKESGPVHFLLGLPASDGSRFHLWADCDRYPAMPPAWHWCDAQGGAIDAPSSTPSGSGFFHSNSVICAPWNRLAYKTLDPRGPHDDWTVGNWRSNPYTKGCTTLAAMALRLSVELMSPRFEKKRQG